VADIARIRFKNGDKTMRKLKKSELKRVYGAEHVVDCSGTDGCDVDTNPNDTVDSDKGGPHD
jgi:hypothetical protein